MTLTDKAEKGCEEATYLGGLFQFVDMLFKRGSSSRVER